MAGLVAVRKDIEQTLGTIQTIFGHYHEGLVDY